MHAWEKIRNFFKYYFSKSIIPPPKIGSEYLIEVCNFSKKFSANGTYVLKNLNFHIGHNEFHVFIGANGAGKTTTIKSIIGAYTKYEGYIYLDGISNRDKKSKQVIGYIPEIANFPLNTSTFSYLLNLAMLSGIEKQEAKKRIYDYAEKLNFSHLLKRSPNTFSSGQKKKILLTQALIHDPKILIMDEPAANLDPASRFEFFEILKSLQLKGKSIFISSHILNELDNYATHCTILHKGTILYNGLSSLSFQEIEIFPIDKETFTNEVKKVYPDLKVKSMNDKFFIASENSVLIPNLLDLNLISGYNLKSFMNLQEIYNKFIFAYDKEHKNEDL